MSKYHVPTFLIFAILTIAVSCNNAQRNESTSNDTTSKQGMATDQHIDFAKSYAQAWCSQKPESVASFFSKNGSLTINNGRPAVGRDSIAQAAEGFMKAFPDMIVSFDSLPTTSKGVEFHWTLTGTNTGPNGTGKKVKVSGFEVWRFDDAGLIQESIGSFDADEYDRQLKYGVDK